MSTTIAVASAGDTCAALFTANPDAVYAEVHSGGTEEWMTVMLPAAGDPAYYMISRDTGQPGRYAISMCRGGYLGDIEPGTQVPGEVTDILTDGIPLRRGVRS